MIAINPRPKKILRKPGKALLAKLGPEARDQIALMEWAQIAKVNSSTDSIFKHLTYINNGGKRSKLSAYIAKLMGEKNGACDLFLALPRGQYHGLFIELKAIGGRPTQDQIDYMHDRAEQGYLSMLCFGWDSARTAITDYLNIRGAV